MTRSTYLPICGTGWRIANDTPAAPVVITGSCTAIDARLVRLRLFTCAFLGERLKHDETALLQVTDVVLKFGPCVVSHQQMQPERRRAGRCEPVHHRSEPVQ